MFVLFVGHAHVTNSVFDNVVKDVIVVHESHLFVLLGNFFEQDSSDGRKVSSRSCRFISFGDYRDAIELYLNGRV